MGSIARQIALKCGGLITGAVLGLVLVASAVLGRLGVARLLTSVSVPQFREHRARTTLTVFGVGLGVAIQLAVAVVDRSVLESIDQTARDLSPQAQLQISAASSGFSEDLLEKVAAVPGVLRAAPTLQQIANIADARARGERLMLVGVDLLGEDDSSFRTYESSDLAAIRKDPLPFLDSPRNLLIGRELAERYGYHVHDKIALTTGNGAKSFEIQGVIDPTGVGRAFGGSIAIMYYPAMQVAFDRGHNIDKIDIAVAPAADLERVRAALVSVLGEGFEVEAPSSASERIARTLGAVREALSLAGFIALLAGAFLIYNTIDISIAQRTHELATLRALGLSRRQVLRLIVTEAALLGVVGALVGTALGLALSPNLLASTEQALSEVYLPLAPAHAVLPYDLIAITCLAGVGLSVLAAIVPSRRAASVAASRALVGPTYEGLAGIRAVARPIWLLSALGSLVAAWLSLRLTALGTQHVRGFVASFMLVNGGLCCLPALIRGLAQLAGSHLGQALGVRFQIASGNLKRDLGRTVGTASAIMVSIAMAVAFATFVKSFNASLETWVEQTLSADLFITSGNSLIGRNTPINDTLYDSLQQLPPVAAVQRTRLVDASFRGSMIKLLSTDSAVYARVAHIPTVECTPEQALLGWARGEVTVSQNFSERFGVHCGDRITLSTGEGSHSFRVAAVVVDYNSEIGTVMMDRWTYAAEWRDLRVDAYELYLRSGEDSQTVRRLLNQRFADHLGLFILTNDEFRALLHDRTSRIFSLLHGLAVLAVLIAVLGITNTQLANVLDRVREIGVLRSLGMRRDQVAALLMIEAAIMGALGAIVGCAIGLGLGFVLVKHIGLAQTGWHLDFRVSFSTIVRTLILTLAAAALAGYFPGRAAARLRITDALSQK